MKLSTYAKLVQKEFLATGLYSPQYVCNISLDIMHKLRNKFPVQEANYEKLHRQLRAIISNKIGGYQTVLIYLWNTKSGLPRLPDREAQREFRTKMLEEIIAESSALENTKEKLQ